jgi:hypothetical protein
MVEGANTNLPAWIFDFYSDRTHGWVAVPWSVLDGLSVSIRLFSSVSKSDTWGVYLDEDYDFPLFETIFRRETGFRIVLSDQSVDKRIGELT